MSERSYHGDIHSDTVHQRTVCPDAECQSTVCLNTVHHRTMCQDTAARAYSFWTRSVRALTFCTQHMCSGCRVSRQMASGQHLPWYHTSRCSCQGTTHPNAAVKAQCVQMQLSRHNVSRHSCQCIMRPDEAAAAYAFQTRSVMAIALRRQHVSYRRRVSKQFSSD